MRRGDDEDATRRADRGWNVRRVHTRAGDLCHHVTSVLPYNPSEVPGIAGMECRDEIILAFFRDDGDDGAGAHEPA